MTKRLLLVFAAFACGWCSAAELVRELVMPTRIVWTSGRSVSHAEGLLAEKRGQVPEAGWEWGRMRDGCCVMTNGGESAAVVVDFGRELHGGLRLAVSAKSSQGMKVRVRFGESVAEAMSELGERGACNDHAIRDSVVDLPVMGTREIGNTGFRFVRLDLVTPGALAIESAHAVSLMRPMKPVGSFRCSDERLNRIFDTAVRTVHLCCQDYLWDGIKRDRLVWMGDMHPETMAILTVFGAAEVIPETLDFVVATTPSGEWANGFPTYTLCWIRNFAAWYRFTGDKAYLRRHADYLASVFAHVRAALPDGVWRKDGEYGAFLDWPTHGNPEAEIAGAQALALLAVEDVRFLAATLGNGALKQEAEGLLAAMRKARPDPHGAKSAAALLALSGLRDPQEMYADFLSKNGHADVSTFYGYYMIEAMSEAGKGQRALDTVRDYWGAMLDVGATSFWEDFDLAWTNGCFRIDELPAAGRRDIHGDCGAYCYKGFRHSFCHGWSAGPAAWCVNRVLGIRPLDVGCKTVEVRPFLGDLDWAEGAMALPDGEAIRVRVEKDKDGALGISVSAPEGVTVLKPDDRPVRGGKPEAAHAKPARWITHPDMADLKPRNVLSRQLERNKLAPVDARYQNRHYLFRRTFDLGAVGKATLRITADDYYKLYVNGQFVGMGPAAGTTDCTYYNVIDLTPYLAKGRNTIAVHTYYQGLVNRVWVSGDNRHGLWLELDADGKRVLESDGAFKVARHTGYSPMGVVGYDTQFLECYDAAAPEVGFERPDFDDANWTQAVRHPIGGDYRLVEQPSPMVVTERVAPVKCERLEKGGLRLDFGGIYVGGVEFAAAGKKGEQVEIRCGQELAADGSVRHKLRANCDYVERMVLSGGLRDVLNQYDYKSFRYVELLPGAGAKIEPESVRLVARHQPFELKAKPTFADPALKPVWDLCVNSFRYGVQEQIMDCMEREKGYYLGDGCYTMLAYCLLTQDWRQARKFFDDFLRTKKVDRGLVTCANCAYMQEIAEYPFMMILFAHWYLEQTGDAAFVAERFDAFADVVDSYRERYARADGLLANLDKWCVVEWPKNFQDGYDADVREGRVCTDVHNAINAWYVIAVRSMNAIAARLGRKPYADAGPLERAFRAVFWDEGRHLFVDREGSRHVSLPGNVYATFGRLAPDGDAAARTAFLALVKEKGYSSISMFQFFPLFCYLRTTGEEALLHDLLVSPDAWLRNVREGGTRTFEGWGRDTKWNTSLFHLTIASAAVFLTDARLTLP